YEVGRKRTIVGSGGTGARNSTPGQQARGRRQQASARPDQHRGGGAPAGAPRPAGGGSGAEPARGPAIDPTGGGQAAPGRRLLIAPRRHASSKPARAQT